MDSVTPLPTLLGFRLADLHGQKQPAQFGYGHWIAYVKNTFETLLAAQNLDFERDPEQVSRSVVIDNLGIASTDFGITPEQKQALFGQGVTATEGWLKTL